MMPPWSEVESSQFGGELGQLVYVTRLLGQDDELGVYGGANSSLKVIEKNLYGEDEEILYVENGRQSPKRVNVDGFTPLRRLPLEKLVRLETITNALLVNELACQRTQTGAPTPPIDAILHAVLPFRVILRLMPDAILAVADSENGMDRLQQIYGNSLAILPYASSSLHLAKACAEAFRTNASPDIVGIFILSQGLLTFGNTAQQAYENLVKLVNRAEDYLKQKGAWHLSVPNLLAADRPIRQELAALRKAIATSAGFPLILSVNPHPAWIGICQRVDLTSLIQQGPAVVRDIAITRRLPMIGRDVEGYRTSANQSLIERSSELSRDMPDAAPRIVLDADFGMASCGRTAAEAFFAGQRYLHTIDIILHATALGGYRALPLRDALAVEMEAFSPRVEALKEASLPFEGEIALVTGGASGIGKACVESLLARGAAVVNLDINPKVKTQYDRPDYLGLECDLTDEKAILNAFETMVKTFGGLDMLVLNAGIFPAGVLIEMLSLAEWQRVMHINLDSNLVILREAYPLLKQSPRGGRVLVNASKNVLAPGAGAAAYSSSKAAITQLGRVAALEWGKDHIRVNMIHPDAIFDTGIWTEEVLQARAAHYGLTVQQYKTRNVLGVELNSHYVGELVAEMLGPRFEKITGAQIPVDGGSDRVI